MCMPQQSNGVKHPINLILYLNLCRPLINGKGGIAIALMFCPLYTAACRRLSKRSISANNQINGWFLRKLSMDWHFELSVKQNGTQRMTKVITSTIHALHILQYGKRHQLGNLWSPKIPIIYSSNTRNAVTITSWTLYNVYFHGALSLCINMTAG